jgi:hypothetical protein
MFKENLLKGKNVYGMITKRTLGESIIDALKNDKDLKALNLQMIYYNGNNRKQESDMTFHSDLKDEHFKDVNEHWQKYNLVLHSSTVTAGVSFDVKDYFDM